MSGIYDAMRRDLESAMANVSRPNAAELRRHRPRRGGEAVSDPIQIPRAVAVQMREALRGVIAVRDDDCGEVDCDECNVTRPLRDAVRVLGNALREPEKERAGTGTPARVAEPEKSASQRGAAYREHITDGSPCWCNPELDYRDPETGAEVWVHRREQ